MKVTVHLSYEGNPQRPVCAWFLPGGQVGDWVRELAASRLAAMGTRLYVVRAAPDDPSAAGLLIVPLPRPDLQWPKTGMACGLIDQTVCLPVEARLSVPLSREELADLSTTALLFLHPTLGVSAFTKVDALNVADLLTCPEDRNETWSSAVPGLPEIPRLHRIRFRPVEGASIYGDSVGPLGQANPGELPAAPGEPPEDPASQWKRKLKGWVVGQVQNTTGHLELGTGSGWKNKIEAWAARQQQAAAEEQNKLRNKEIHRLIHMLEEDPDLGLRHAIPLSGFPHRGIAKPVTRLSERAVEFELGRLGGGPADFWEVPADLREQLRHRYRQMADAELRAGRYRRAAYIYGELLGDLAASAGALREGRHFREAAVLYSERLNLRLEAARCLAEGGLLREAIDVYQQLNRLMDVADLHTQLGEHELAERALRSVIQQRLEAADFLGAAKLLEEKLKLPSEALHVLAAGWPSSSQAVRCLETHLGLLARLGRHEEACQLVMSVSVSTRPMSPPVALLELLSHTAVSYPDSKVRMAAGDACRVIAADELAVPHAALEPTLAAQLLEALVRSAPEDRLLARDANRFLSRVRSSRPSPTVASVLGQVESPGGAKRTLSGPRHDRVREFQLPPAIQWMHARAVEGGYLAAGWRGPRFALARGRWNGKFQVLFWNLPGVPVHQRRIFEALLGREQQLELAVPFSGQLTPQAFPQSDDLQWPELMVSPVSWLGDKLLAVHRGAQVVWALQSFADRVSLSAFEGATGRPGYSLDVTELVGGLRGEGLTDLHLSGMGNGAVIGHDQHAWLVRDQKEILQLNLPGRLTALIPTPAGMRSGLVLCHERGAVLAWAGQAGWMDLELDLASPMGGFNPLGQLLLISGSGPGHLVELDPQEGTVASIQSAVSPVTSPLALTAAEQREQFAVFSQDGGIHVIQFRGRGLDVSP